MFDEHGRSLPRKIAHWHDSLRCARRCGHTSLVEALPKLD
jgi:hypothetical protein